MTPSSIHPIVSSAHLAEGEGWELSEFEYGLMVAHNAFSRWVTRCMAASGRGDLSQLEILVLHHLNHRHREKRLNDICFVLNIEDTHTVNYALKKLVKLELIETNKRGKEVFYITSETGKDLCEEYRELREQILLKSLKNTVMDGKSLSEVAEMLRSLSGHYDQASRVASSY